MRTPAPAGSQPNLVILAAQSAPATVGVKVVRPRLRPRALHHDTAASTGAPRHQNHQATTSAPTAPPTTVPHQASLTTNTPSEMPLGAAT